VGGFVGREHFGVDIVDAQRLGDYPRTAAIIAGEQMAADVPRLELGHGFQRAGLESVAESEQPEYPRLRALLDQPGQGAALGFPGLGRSVQCARVQPVVFQQTAVA